MIHGKFKCHIDASLYGFKWNDNHTVEVEYIAEKRETETVISITNLTAAPYLLGMIVVQNNWFEFIKHIEHKAFLDSEQRNGIDLSNINKAFQSAFDGVIA